MKEDEFTETIREDLRILNLKYVDGTNLRRVNTRGLSRQCMRISNGENVNRTRLRRTADRIVNKNHSRRSNSKNDEKEIRSKSCEVIRTLTINKFHGERNVECKNEKVISVQREKGMIYECIGMIKVLIPGVNTT